MAPFPFTIRAELAMCQRCSRRATDKDGGMARMWQGSSGEREQMGGVEDTKVEAAKMRRQD